MNEQPITLGTAILELINLYHDNHIEYYKVVVTICAMFRSDPARVPWTTNSASASKRRARLFPHQPESPLHKEEENHRVTTKSPTAGRHRRPRP